MKIDEKTMVPLGFMIAAQSVVLAGVISATFWIASVNNRLSRIEDRLGVEKLSSATYTAFQEKRNQK